MKDKIALLIGHEKGLIDYIIRDLKKHDLLVDYVARAIDYQQAIAKRRPDIIIVDWDLKRVNGRTICNDIKATYPDIPLIVISSKTDKDMEEFRNAFECGAVDYIKKPVDTERLAIRVLARIRSIDKDKKVYKVADLTMDDLRKEVTRNDIRINLSKTEYDLLKYLIINKNQVVSRESILSRVWGTEKYIEDRVVDVYVGYLRKKIDTGHKKKLIRTRRGFGYILG